MIPTASKFPLRTNFLSFQKLAKQQTLSHLRLLSASTKSPADLARLAVIVPKKVSKLASTRTWLKRLTYDTLRPQIKDKRFDLVVIYKPLPLKKSIESQKLIVSEIMLLDIN